MDALSLDDIFKPFNESFNLTKEFREGLLAMIGQNGFSRTLDGLNLYVMPLIIAAGLSGNTLSLLVFTCSHLKLKSSSVYLATLSIADMGFLLCLFVVWLLRVNISLFHYHGVCQCIVYMNYVFAFTSSWSVVAFTTERYVIVFHPRLRKKWCTQKTALIITLIITISALIGYTVSFMTNGVREINSFSICAPLPEHANLLLVLTGADMFMAFLVPSVIICTLNIRIILQIKKCQKLIVTGSLSSSNALIKANSHDCNKCPKTVLSKKGSLYITFNSGIHGHFFSESMNQRETQSDNQRYCVQNVTHVCSIRRNLRNCHTSRLLIIVSSIFIILNCPSHIVRLKTFIQNFASPDTILEESWIHWQGLFQIVYFFNFSINFFVYSAYSSTFRKALKSLLTGWVSRLKKPFSK